MAHRLPGRTQRSGLLRRCLLLVAGQSKLSRQPAPRVAEEYIDALRKYQPVDEAYFYAQLRHFVLFRTMQVLGAYGFRGYFEKKPHFIQSVPFAIENLRQLLQEPYPEYPYLCQILRELTELKQFTDDLQKAPPRGESHQLCLQERHPRRFHRQRRRFRL